MKKNILKTCCYGALFCSALTFGGLAGFSIKKLFQIFPPSIKKILAIREKSGYTGLLKEYQESFPDQKKMFLSSLETYLKDNWHKEDRTGLHEFYKVCLILHKEEKESKPKNECCEKKDPWGVPPY